MTTLELPTGRPVEEISEEELLRKLRIHPETFQYWDGEKRKAWLEAVREKGRPETPQELAYVVSRRNWHNVEIMVLPNYYFYTVGRQEDTWNQALINGRSYMVGSDVPMDKYVRDHRSPLSAWQKNAYDWAKEHPGWKVSVETRTHDWYVYCRGLDYVEFGLPHQDKGGERHYVTRDGRSKILVNVD